MARKALPVATLLSIVPYFNARGSVSVAAAAADLKLEVQQLRDALWQLWTCGLPGYGAGELIDLSFSTDDLEDAEFVEVTFTAGLDRPVRLTASEAILLETALAVLATQPAVAGKEELLELRRTLARAAGSDVDAGGAELDDEGEAGDSGTAEVLRHAMSAGRALQFTYYTASSDRYATRVVDPVRLSVTDGHTYLHGVDRDSGQWRTFRTDRISDGVDAGERRDTGPEPDDVLQPGARRAAAILRGSAAWLLDDFPFASHAPREDGDIDVEIAFHGQDWLVRFLLGHADVLTPTDAELAADVAELAASARARHKRLR